ncbi:MAG: hypothetical protein GX639_17010, partial [Fibrobacter sp.]|nr:hypothetical protein [Fibrobacter sp.]
MSHFEQLLYATLRIEVSGEDGDVMSMGTGFLLAKPIDSVKGKVYLISNRHVFEYAKALAINLTMSASGVPDHGNVYRMVIDDVSGCVTNHPNPNIDVAALEVTGLIEHAPNNYYMKWFNYGMLSDFSESELSIAENVHFIGYPD